MYHFKKCHLDSSLHIHFIIAMEGVSFNLAGIYGLPTMAGNVVAAGITSVERKNKVPAPVEPAFQWRQ